MPIVLGGFLHVGEVGLRRQPADALGVEQAGLDLGEDAVRFPAFAGGPAGGHRRTDRFRFDAARVAVLDELSPERTADRRASVIVIERDDGIQGELAVVHALGEDDVIVAVGRLGADPGHVGPLAGMELGRGLEEDGLAVLEFLAFRQGLE